MNTDLVIGVDIGTSSVKAGIYGLDGVALGTATSAVGVDRHADGSVTQSLDTLYDAAASAVTECLATTRAAPARVGAIAFSGQMAGVGLVDAYHRPIIPYDSWLDTRCGVVVDALSDEVRQRILSVSGCAPTVAIGPKMAWWAQYQPEVVDTTAKFVTAAGYVAGRAAQLSGDEAFIDPSYLHFTSIADTANGTWDTELAHVLGVPLDRLPRIVESSDIIGYVGPEAATDFGLPQGVPIAAGCGDTAACAVGAGIDQPLQAFDVAGTAAVLGIRLPSFVTDPTGTLLTMRSPLGSGAFALAYVGGAGELIDWLCSVVLGHTAVDDRAYADLDQVAQDADAGSDGLLVSPHFSGRVTPAHPTMRGALIGLEPRHGRPQIARSVLEAIAYEYKIFAVAALALAGTDANAKVTQVVGTGGGSKLRFWNEIKASVLDAPYSPLQGVDAGTRGAALVALAAIGATVPSLGPNAAAATVQPRRQDADIYTETFANYVRWTRRLADGFTREPALATQTIDAGIKDPQNENGE